MMSNSSLLFWRKFYFFTELAEVKNAHIRANKIFENRLDF